MGVRYQKLCSVCKLSKGNPKFRARVYNAAYNWSDGLESLPMIAKEFGLTQRAIYNHKKKHMTENKKIGDALVVKRVEKIKVKTQNDLTAGFDHEDVVPKEDFELTWDTVIADGMEQLKRKDKEVTINQLLAATKLKSDFTAKKRGQDVEIIKTMYRSMNAQHKPTADEPGDMAVGSPQRPGDILGETLRNAATRGAEALPQTSS